MSEKAKISNNNDTDLKELQLLSQGKNSNRNPLSFLKQHQEIISNTTPIGLFIISSDGTILDINQEGERTLEDTRLNLLNSNLNDIISSAIPDFHIFLKNIQNSETKVSCEIYSLINPTRPKYFLLWGTIISGTNKYLITTTDITLQKEKEKDLNVQKKLAEERDRLKSAFIANMSHEIRTPMNGILGFAELLNNSALNSKQKRSYIRMIGESGQRMLNIVNDIISISQIESGQMKVSLSETNISEQINFVVTFFKPEADRKGLKIQKNIPSFLKKNNIITDREKVYAILTNLVKNAIKFTNQGSIEIGYKEKRESIELYVKDTGAGITESNLRSIFERFKQVKNSTTRYLEGAGLGLAISKAYVEILGGKLWIKSSIGKGSTFYFTLPKS